MTKFLIRLTAIWLAAVVFSMTFGVGSSIAGYDKLSAILGIVFITLFGGAIVIVMLGLCVVIWQLASNVT